MQNFLKKQRQALALIGYALILVAVFFFAVKPLLAKINARRDQIQEELATQEDRKKQILALPNIKEQYLAVQKENDKLSVLISKDEAVNLIESIEKLASDTNNAVKITIVQADPNSREAILAQKQAAQDKQSGDKNKDKNKDVSLVDTLPGKNYLEIKISLKGKYNDALRFMEKLENMHYYSDILSFDMRAEDSSSGQANQITRSSDPFANRGQSPSASPVEVSSEEQKIVTDLEVVFYLKQ